MNSSLPISEHVPDSAAGSDGDSLATGSFHRTAIGGSTTTADVSADPRVVQAVEEYLAAQEAGRAPPREQFLGQHPDIAAELSQYLGALELMRDGSPRAGERVGDYELLAEISRGGMGVVYKARHRTMGRTVALKTLRGDFQSQPDLVQRFFREVRATARLNHPNIVPIYEVGEHQGQPYYTMAFVSGGSLAKHKDKFAADPKSALALVEKIARAVQHAHEQGILHRDLKPGNILLDEHGEPLVTDFGLAKFRDEAEVELTQSGAVLGTPAYMAPEQAAGRTKEIGPAADVWALGVLLYELLAGRRPFVGESTEEIRRTILTREPESLRMQRRSISRDMETIALKCLEKEPGRRYESAGAIAEDLSRCGRGEPIHARPASSVRRVLLSVRRHPLRTALCLFLAMGLLAGALAIHYSDPGRSLKNYQKQLERGEPVTLIGDSALPRWHCWHFREGALKKGSAYDGIVLECTDLSLLELCLPPRSPGIRFRAQMRHDDTGRRGQIGLFFGLEENTGPAQKEYRFCSLMLRDPHPKESVQSQHYVLELVLQRCRGLSPSRMGTSIRKEVPIQLPSPWQTVAVEVTDEEVRVFWMEEVVGTISRASLAAIYEDLKQSDARGDWLREHPRETMPPDGLAVPPELKTPFASDEGLGIAVYDGAAFFRNVAVEPLGVK